MTWLDFERFYWTRQNALINPIQRLWRIDSAKRLRRIYPARRLTQLDPTRRNGHIDPIRRLERIDSARRLNPTRRIIWIDITPRLEWIDSRIDSIVLARWFGPGGLYGFIVSDCPNTIVLSSKFCLWLVH